MSEPVVASAPKQGMSTGLKVLVGCLLALVLLGLGTCAACYFGAKKLGNTLQGYADKVQNDPDGAAFDAAVIAFKFNPDLEIVAKDEAAKTITVRSKKDGKEVTFNLDDIKSGNLSIESEGQKVNVGVQEGENGGGSMTFESDKGKMVLGGGGTDNLPEWIPMYPGARTDGVSSLEVNGAQSGTFTLHTSDSVDEVLAFYEAQLKSAGFAVSQSKLDVPGAVSANLNAKAENRTINVTVAEQEGETQGLVAYEEKP